MKAGKKIRADMISRPQNDLRHTGHIGMPFLYSVHLNQKSKQYADCAKVNISYITGYDGAMFGDVSFIGDQYDKLPVKVVNPCK